MVKMEIEFDLPKDDKTRNVFTERAKKGYLEVAKGIGEHMMSSGEYDSVDEIYIFHKKKQVSVCGSTRIDMIEYSARGPNIDEEFSSRGFKKFSKKFEITSSEKKNLLEIVQDFK